MNDVIVVGATNALEGNIPCNCHECGKGDLWLGPEGQRLLAAEPTMELWCMECAGIELEQPAPLRIIRTPIRHRLIVWPGMPFRTLPFPYLFHRYDVISDNQGWWAGFWRRKSAEQWIDASRDPGAEMEES